MVSLVGVAWLASADAKEVTSRSCKVSAVNAVSDVTKELQKGGGGKADHDEVELVSSPLCLLRQ